MRKLLSILVISAMLGSPVWSQEVITARRRAATSVPTHVQSCSAALSGVQSSITATCPGAIGTGHYLQICMYNFTNALSGNVTFNYQGGGGSFSPTEDLADITMAAGQYGNCWHVTSSAPGGGDDAISATYTSMLQFPRIVIDEFSNTTIFDQSDAGATGTGTSMASNAITPSVNGTLVIGVLINTGAGGTITEGMGYTLGAKAGGDTIALEYKVQGTAASTTATGTLSMSDDWGAHVVSVKP